VPRSNAAFCRAHVAWECALVFLPDDEVEYLEESEELRHDPAFDENRNTTVCMACYAALTPASPSGLGRLDELDATAEALRRRGLVVADDSIKRDLQWYRENWTLLPAEGAPTAAEPPGDPSTEDFVYFLSTEDRTRIKIGHSIDPTDRRGDLQTGSPEELSILHVTTGDRKVERQWQQRFVHLRAGVGEEWFRADQELLDAIERDREGNPKEAERMLRVAGERREQDRARRELRRAGYEGPYHPAQIRLGAATSAWRSMTRRAQHFVLPWKDPKEHHAVVAFGKLLPPNDDPAEEQLRTRGKVPAWTHSIIFPEGESGYVPLEHLTLIRDVDFERAVAKDFDYTIPDLIADHMRDGLDRSLVHHKLLEWWRKGFAFDLERERARLPPPWTP
jgi:hypothetical protein